MNLAMLHNIPTRMIFLAMAATLFCTILASYLYLFKTPLRDYKRLQMNRTLLEAKIENEGNLSGEIDALAQEVQNIIYTLQGKTPLLPVSEMIAHTIGRLDAISRRHDIELVSIRPGGLNRVHMFEEIPFAIEVLGNYFKLYGWLRDVEKELGPMVVKNFELGSKSMDDKLLMKLSMVSYRPSRTLQ